MCAGPVRRGGERTGHAARKCSYRPYPSVIPHTVRVITLCVMTHVKDYLSSTGAQEGVTRLESRVT